MNNYYQLVDDESIQNRWYLDETISTSSKLSVWDITTGTRVLKETQVDFNIQHNGIPLDFTLTAFEVPVVDEKVAAIFKATNPENVQLLPALIEGKSSGYKVLNITKLIDCVDEKKSVFDRWTNADGRPDKVGQYKTMIDLKLDKSKINPNDHCFRVLHWEVAIIVSDYIKMKIEDIDAIGAKFITRT